MKWILDNWEKGLALLTVLLGRSAALALLLIVLIAVALSYTGHLIPAAHTEIAYALFIIFFFGLIVVAYGIFSTHEVHGLKAGTGFFVGVLAGASAALTGGAFFYALNMPDCAIPHYSAKLLAVLAGAVPIGGILGALFGLMRPTSQKSDPTPQRPPASEFIPFILGIAILLVLCCAFIYIFANLDSMIEAEIAQLGPQGFIRFWQVSLIVISFLIVYTGSVVFLYGRPEVQQTTSFRSEKTISSVVAALFCTIVLFGSANWFLGQADFELRVAANVANRCPKDPTQQNLLSDIIIWVIILLVLGIATYLAATYDRSPLLRVVDKWIWDRPCRRRKPE
jgi:hypothetical protein